MPALKNAKHEAFAQAVTRGETLQAAYIASYPAAAKWKPDVAKARGYELSRRADVSARMDELKEAAASAAIADRRERMELLSAFARDEQAFPKSRMQAIDLLNKMDGEYVKRIEATVTGDVSEIAGKVGAILDE